MEFKQARETLDGIPNKITLDQIMEEVKNNGQLIMYFDKENNAKDLKKLEENFKKDGYSVHCHEIRYGLDSEDYVYEVHIIR